MLYEFLQWARAHGAYPKVAMGASAGGYAAADVATGTHETVLKGWTKWGFEEVPPRHQELPEYRSLGGLSRFRSHLHHSIRYVMSARELAGIFDTPPESRTRLMLFTSRVRRIDGKTFRRRDSRRFFFKMATRKLPSALKYTPEGYAKDAVIFVSHLSSELSDEFVRPLTRVNFHNAVEASCLVPYAMGDPLAADELLPVRRGLDSVSLNACANDDVWEKRVAPHRFSGDRSAVFMDGGITLKMPFRIFVEDARFQRLAELARCDKTIVFCCDPRGRLWENSMRLVLLNQWETVRRATERHRMFILFPDHSVEAGFLNSENRKIMRTFERGRAQGRRILDSAEFQSFLDAN